MKTALSISTLMAALMLGSSLLSNDLLLTYAIISIYSLGVITMLLPVKKKFFRYVTVVLHVLIGIASIFILVIGVSQIVHSFSFMDPFLIATDLSRKVGIPGLFWFTVGSCGLVIIMGAQSIRYDRKTALIKAK